MASVSELLCLLAYVRAIALNLLGGGDVADFEVKLFELLLMFLC